MGGGWGGFVLEVFRWGKVGKRGMEVRRKMRMEI